jgi:hypothetical protein
MARNSSSSTNPWGPEDGVAIERHVIREAVSWVNKAQFVDGDDVSPPE